MLEAGDRYRTEWHRSQREELVSGQRQEEHKMGNLIVWDRPPERLPIESGASRRCQSEVCQGRGPGMLGTRGWGQEVAGGLCPGEGCVGGGGAGGL